VKFVSETISNVQNGHQQYIYNFLLTIDLGDTLHYFVKYLTSSDFIDPYSLFSMTVSLFLSP